MVRERFLERPPFQLRDRAAYRFGRNRRRLGPTDTLSSRIQRKARGGALYAAFGTTEPLCDRTHRLPYRIRFVASSLLLRSRCPYSSRVELRGHVAGRAGKRIIRFCAEGYLRRPFSLDADASSSILGPTQPASDNNGWFIRYFRSPPLSGHDPLATRTIRV